MTTRFLLLAAIAITAVACSSDPSTTNAGGDGGSHGDDSGTGGSDSGTPDDAALHDGGNGPGEGGGPHDSGAIEAGPGGFGATCDPQSNMCPTAYPTCFTFNAKGPHCTKQCASAADCPGGAGGLGCTGMGVCKVQ